VSFATKVAPTGRGGCCGSGFDETTGKTTSHLTKAASCQVIGYSQSTKHNKAEQVAGYSREVTLTTMVVRIISN
jgi:hypothetical protein